MFEESGTLDYVFVCFKLIGVRKAGRDGCRTCSQQTGVFIILAVLSYVSRPLIGREVCCVVWVDKLLLGPLSL